MYTRIAALVVTSALALGAHAAEADRAAAARIEADVRFLADDLLEGREAGTRGHELAALYVASRFRAIGLEPGGDDGSYLQSVPLIKGVRRKDGARLVLHGPEGDRSFAFESEFLPAIDFFDGAADVTAPLVFVGFGVHAPDLGYDDLAGVELGGKIAVLFGNAPSALPGDPRAYHSDTSVKFAELERRGAVGVISIQNPVSAARYPWSRSAENWRRPSMRMRDAAGKPVDEYPGLRVRVSCSLVASEALFAGAPKSFAEVKAGLESGRPQSFDLPGTATLASRATLETLSSPNVVARLPGTHRGRAAEHIMFTAHLDHLGIGVPRNGDAIYNGAMDNAIGIATLLETARGLAADRRRNGRSMVFVATTAEEKGLLGAEHYARNPTVPADSMVAIINIDMPIALAGLRDVMPIGIEHSSLRAVAEREIRREGLLVGLDPFPEEVSFIRSDQYPFIRAGVPAIYLDSGTQAGDGIDGMARHLEFLKNVYHLPGDDLSVAIDWNYAVRLARVNQNIARAIASSPSRPSWNPGDFFGDRFGRKDGRGHPAVPASAQP